MSEITNNENKQNINDQINTPIEDSSKEKDKAQISEINMENKINENNINNINNIDDENDDEDNGSNLMKNIYSETKSPEKKRKSYSQEPKRNKTLNFKNKERKKKNKTLNEDKDYKQLKEDIDKGINFIDYFLIIGISPIVFFEDKIYEYDIDELKIKYKDKLQPKIISYFPNYEKKTIAFDDSIISHCFPNGFNIVKCKKKPKMEIFSFILDNNYFNLNYPQKYLSCLICYESIDKYRYLYEEYIKLSNINKNNEVKKTKKKNKSQRKINKLKKNKIPKSQSTLDLKAMENLNVSSDTNLVSSINDNEKIYIPKCIMIMSLYPFFYEYEKILFRIYRYSKNIIREAKQLNIKTTNNIGRATEYYVKARTMTMPKIPINKSNLPKREKITIPIDKIIENLVIEFPAPPRGVFTVEYSLITKDIKEIKTSLMNKLPLIEVNLKKIFITFTVEKIVEIYLNLFLETRILFFSKDIEVLNIFIYGFLSLLFPFQYQYQIITILPEENFSIIESITPFIAGINQNYQDDFFEKRDMILSDTILVVDIDKEKTVFVNKESEIPEFPRNKKKALEKNLQNLLSSFMKEELKQKMIKNNEKKSNKVNNSINNDNKTNDTSDIQAEFSFNISEDNINSLINKENEEEDDDIEDMENSIINNPYSNFKIDFDFNNNVNEIFFDFNANLLCNYSKYLNLDFYSSNEAARLEILFKVDNFLNDVPNAEKDFYNKFITETQLFGDFIYMRMIPKNSREKIQILSFDEQINKNYPNIYNKSQQNIFLDSKEYDFCNKYSVQKARKITKEEKDFYKDIENQKKLVSYGIIITEEKNTGNIYFKYPIFPRLTTEFFFADNFREYFVPNNLNENIETINEDIISKSHLGGIETKQDDMVNYIYLSWLQMWGMTFWYCDEQEKKYWFQALKKIIEKTTSHEMEIYNLLFDTLSMYGKDYMVLELYDILLKLHLNPSFKVHNIVMKLLDKKKTKMQKSMNNQLKNSYQKDASSKNMKKNFRKRTFKSKYYGNILFDDIIIYAFDTCINCQKDVNLETLSLNYKDMNRELMWTKCPNCGENILPKITIQYGTEINRSGKLKVNTSKNDVSVLFSPYFLKVNNNSLLRKFGIKLDVEELMLKYNTIFWNSVWYFKLNNLDFDFMLPYQQYLDKKIFDKTLILDTFELEKDLLNNKIIYEDEEDDNEIYRYSSDDLKIETFHIEINKQSK